MLGKFSSADFFKINFLEKFFIRVSNSLDLGPDCLHLGYQQMTKVKLARKEPGTYGLPNFFMGRSIFAI